MVSLRIHTSVTPSKRHRDWRLWCLYAAYAIPVAMLIFIVCHLTVNVPYWDDFGAILGWFSVPWPDRIENLLNFHNEHRLMTARLTFEAIYRVLDHFDFQVCMAVGATFLLGYAALIGKMMRPAGPYFHWVFCPCFWLIISFIQYENLCWAMTAVSNFQVHFWALLALFAAVRGLQYRYELFLATICATMATLSVGGGMAIWPCLVLVAAIRHRKISAFTYGLVGLTVIALYLQNFPHAGESEASFSLVRATVFFISFAGSWVPCFPIAIVVGAATLILLAYFAFRFNRLRDLMPLAFAIYLLGNMAAAALFRSGDIHGAMSFRYILLPISLLACTTVLFVENIHLPDKTIKVICGIFMAGAVIYSAVFLVLGGPQFAHRNEIMRRNILCWPKHPNGLRSAFPQQDSLLLDKCRAAGVYDPQWVRKDGETPPSAPIPWLR